MLLQLYLLIKAGTICSEKVADSEIFMKKFLLILTLSLICVLSAVGFTACDNAKTNGTQNTAQEQTGENEYENDEEQGIIETVSAVELLNQTVKTHQVPLMIFVL